MSKEQLKKEAEDFAEREMGYSPRDIYDFAEEKDHMIDYLIEKLLELTNNQQSDG